MLVELARRMDAELHVIEWAQPDPNVFGAPPLSPLLSASRLLRPFAEHGISACSALKTLPALARSKANIQQEWLRVPSHRVGMGVRKERRQTDQDTA